MEDSWVPDACTLPTADQPLRVADFADVLAGAVLGASRTGPDRLHLDLRPDREVAARVAGLVTAETECCSFFTFTLTATGGALSLDVSVPPARVAVLDGLAQQAQAVTALAADRPKAWLARQQ